MGIAGQELTGEEAALFEASPPAGIILFSRNVGGLMPLRRLMGDLREVLPADSFLMVDQEGGRVSRLGPPDWDAQPSAGSIGALFPQAPAAATRLAWLTGALMGLDCAEAGFDVVCAPVLDVLAPGATEAIGDRSFGSDPDVVSALAQAVADGLLSAGVQPVGKHAPGHGRARIDSHVGLPRLGAEEDMATEIAVFTACAGLPWMMTAHIVYEGIDPARPGTLSAIVIEGVIRGTIGFNGVLVSDDLAMGALAGAPGDLACAALEAGCDVAMHCSGQLPDLHAVLEAVPDVSDLSFDRISRARGLADRCRLQLSRPVLLADREALFA